MHNINNIDSLFSKRRIGTIARLNREFLAPYKQKIIYGIILMIISAICAFLSNKLTEPAINQIFIIRNKKMLFLFPIMILCIFMIKAAADYFYNYIIKYVGQNIITDLQIEMYRSLLKADLKFIENNSSGRLISRFMNDLTIIKWVICNTLVNCFRNFFTVIFLIALMFNLEARLSLLIVWFFPIVLYPIHYIAQNKKYITEKIQREIAGYANKLDETFFAIKMIKAFNREKTEIRAAQKLSKNILELYKKSLKIEILASPMMEITTGIVIALILWYVGFFILEDITPGKLIAFITSFLSAYRPFKNLVVLHISIQEGMVAIERVFDVLDIKSTIYANKEHKFHTLQNPQIEFKNVNLLISTHKILNDINVAFTSGKIYAIVGCSGSGKTSLANLLIRFYDMTSGKITINNIDIKDIQLQNLRSQIALVTQENIILNDTIYENILYGKKNVAKKEFEKAIELTDMKLMIDSLPNKYDTILGMKGNNISVGQQQKISIARALLKNSPILFLDEVTSGLDNKSEKNIVDSLMKIKHDKIIILVTHRLDTIKNVDQIIVMKDGSIVESGQHDVLINNKSHYYNLYCARVRNDK